MGMAFNVNFAERALAHFAAKGDTRMAAIASDAIQNAPTVAELIREAGLLNNHPALINTDHVSIMGLMDRDECERHVEKLRALAA